jgi:hypothetical protein
MSIDTSLQHATSAIETDETDSSLFFMTQTDNINTDNNDNNNTGKDHDNNFLAAIIKEDELELRGEKLGDVIMENDEEERIGVNICSMTCVIMENKSIDNENDSSKQKASLVWILLVGDEHGRVSILDITKVKFMGIA